MQFLSPAKVNLFLRIIKKRDDGYHELASLFQAVSLFDKITFALSKEDKFTCTDSRLPIDEHNLIQKAIALYRKKTQFIQPLEVHLEKHIPIEAGLGGGSSNAATTLFALNSLNSHLVDEPTLANWAAEIGSDVAFFLSSGSAYCTGRGEKIEEISNFQWNKKIWLVKPAIGLSTPLIYKTFSLALCSKKDPRVILMDFLQGKYHFVNDLEEAAFSLLPSLKELKMSLLEQGFEDVFMTGSGTGLICVGHNIPTVTYPTKCYPLCFLNRKVGQWYTDQKTSTL